MQIKIANEKSSKYCNCRMKICNKVCIPSNMEYDVSV